MSRVRIIALLALAACCAIGVPAALASGTGRSPAHSAAAHKRVKSAKKKPKVHVIKGAPLTLGISSPAVAQLASANASTNSVWTARARLTGVQMVRLGASWSSIAPAKPPTGFVASNPGSPGYNWTALDQQVRALAAEGFEILITVSGAPTWAEGANAPSWAPAGTWKPSDSDFAQFAKAIATRYDGRFPDPLHPGHALPRVHYWQAWNEPNMTVYLTPQFADEDGPAKSSGTDCPGTDQSAALSPGLYRGLLNAFYAAVKGVSPANYVVMAGTAPYSVPNCQPGSGNYRMPAVRFDQGVFCLSPSNARLPGCATTALLDAVDTHPYDPPNHGPCGNTICGPTWSAPTGDTAIPDVHEITAAVRAGVAAGTIKPKRKKGVWVTEIAWDTTPEDSQGVPAPTQALWEEQANYLLWKQGVTTILWWQLADAPTFSGWPDAAGEFRSNGTAKPSARAYRFPFVTNRTSKTGIVAWGRSPAGGRMRVEKRAGRRWRTVATFAVTAREVFQIKVSQRGRASFRAQIGRITSLNWAQGA